MLQLVPHPNPSNIIQFDTVTAECLKLMVPPVHPSDGHDVVSLPLASDEGPAHPSPRCIISPLQNHPICVERE